MKNGGSNLQRVDAWLFWLMVLVYLGSQWAYAVVHEGVWDDDCVTRYFNTQDAFRMPEQFVSGWNRPLFVMLFSLPLQAGRWMIPVLMPLLTAAGAWALYRALRIRSVQATWLIAPLYLLQSYLFGTSRHALTEPLAALLICLGFLFMTQRRWLLFALMGALLPLARMELTPLLLLWAIPLLIHRRTMTPLLASGLLVWCLASTLIVGDFLHPFRALLDSAAEKSRYGNVPLEHYALRFIHVLGPVVFLWMIVGMVEKIAALRKSAQVSDVFVHLQLVIGLLLYSLIAAKFSAGNPAGFLRNLVPLAPLAALVAHEGLLSARDAVRGGNSARLRIGITVAMVLLMGGTVFSGLLIERLDLFLQHPQLNLFFLLGAVLLVLLWGLPKVSPKVMEVGAGFALAAMLSFFLFVAIPPDRFLSNERMLMGMTMDVMDNSPLRGSHTFVNHNWYYWRKGFSPHAGKTGHMLRAELSRALAGSVAIWDNHYSHRLGGDVDFVWFAQHPEWRPMFYFFDKDGLARYHVYQKMGPQEDYLGRLNAMAEAQPYIASVPQLRAQWRWTSEHDTLGAERDVRTALSLQINDPQSHHLMGTLYLARHQADSALPHFSTAAQLSPQDPGPWAGMGQAYELLAQWQFAREAYLRALKLAPKHLEANEAMWRLDSLGI